jgi:hypothetical protein
VPEFLQGFSDRPFPAGCGSYPCNEEKQKYYDRPCLHTEEVPEHGTRQQAMHFHAHNKKSKRQKTERNQNTDAEEGENHRGGKRKNLRENKLQKKEGKRRRGNTHKTVVQKVKEADDIAETEIEKKVKQDEKEMKPKL